MPIASESPSSDIVLSVNPQAHTAMNAASVDTGSASPVITVERQLFRKRKTTRTVSNAPSMSASSTLRTELRTRSPASFTIASFTPAGSVRWIATTCALMSSATRAVLVPLVLVMSSPMPG